MQWVSPDFDIRIFREWKKLLPMRAAYVSQLEEMYERWLGVTSAHIQRLESIVPAEFEVRLFFLVSYTVCPPSKLMSMGWPFRGAGSSS